MVSESARVTTAEESRYRIQTQPPTSRVVTVMDLDGASEAELARLVDAVPSADLVVMKVSAGGRAGPAAAIGKACSDRGIMTATIVIRAASTGDAALSKTLGQVRPWSLMVVVASDEAYVGDILTSFR